MMGTTDIQTIDMEQLILDMCITDTGAKGTETAYRGATYMATTGMGKLTWNN